MTSMRIIDRRTVPQGNVLRTWILKYMVHRDTTTIQCVQEHAYIKLICTYIKGSLQTLNLSHRTLMLVFKAKERKKEPSCGKFD